MPPKGYRLDRRPSVLDSPSFQAPDVGIVQRSHVQETISTERQQIFIVTPKPSLKLNTRPIINQVRRLQPSPSTNTHHNPSESPIILNPNPTAPTNHLPTPQPLKNTTQASQHRRPLPPRKLRKPKNASEPSQITTAIDQALPTNPNLSKALRQHLLQQQGQVNFRYLSNLPFFEEDDLEAAQTSWLLGREYRRMRIQGQRNDSVLAVQDPHIHTHTHSHHRPDPPHQLTHQYIPETTTLLRHGPKHSSTPLLVRWTSLTGDRLQLHDPRAAMPREIRFLLFEEIGKPFGVEGEDWNVDGAGRVWLRERRGAKFGRWWGNGEGRW